MTIKIEITGESAGEVFMHLRELAGIGVPTIVHEPVEARSAPAAEMINEIGSQGMQAMYDAGRVNEQEPVEEHSDAELDAHGHPWSADLHASTKGKTKEGLWRMKPGANRPDPKPGFPIEDASTSTASTGETASTPSEVAPIEDAGPAEPVSTEDDDEFAAFRQAAAKVDAETAEAVAAVPVRKWTDADLGALCNQAAVKLGDPLPIKAIIAGFVPEGEVAHSRNVPADKRAEFVAAIEAKAGIEFAG